MLVSSNFMSHSMRTIVAIGGLLICTSIAAQPIPKGDPAIGSYPFFLALDRKCSTPDSARAAALAKFKAHFIANVRFIAASFEPNGGPMVKAADELARDGPSAADLTRFESIFHNTTQAELAELCSGAARQIEERMALENKIKESMLRANGPTR